ncbi:PIR Superfamily Protein [Plasmodium ovale wallikeri]|uniref:PIR Superfamily Protein n=1 Tax=Plasmodium ovale wallikeri TaxID=864142 RepID=A0A1A8YNF3_PLAOA|nr:PIR Superfamily Protein [Plasmodium ovale wallikeri]SBT58888.1 PIR Superfamily Protein [Plasmodium ovale wallikeri]
MPATDNGMPYLYAAKNDEKMSYYYDDWGDQSECGKLQGKVKYKGFTKFCVTLTGLLSELKNLKIYFLFENDRCTPVTMWMYDHINNKLSKENEGLLLHSVIVNLIELWDKKVADPSCKIHDVIYSEETSKKTKILYDYALDYQNMKNKIETDNSKCTKSFKEYVENCVQTYKEIKQDCNITKDKHYCKLFQKIDDHFDKHDLSDLVCKEEIPDPIPGERSPYLEDEDDPFPDHATQLDHGSQSSDASSNSALAIVLPFIGTLLTLLALYKFTPFGSLIHKQLIKKLKMRHISNEHESQELYENEYESMIMDSHTSGHNIGYHSS